MYTEPFNFQFLSDVKDSERMLALVNLFQLAENNEVDRESFGGYKIKNNGVVKFWSYDPDLTKIVVDWLKIQVKADLVKVYEPTYFRNT